MRVYIHTHGYTQNPLPLAQLDRSHHGYLT